MQINIAKQEFKFKLDLFEIILNQDWFGERLLVRQN